MLDSSYVKNTDNIDNVKNTMESLKEMQEAIYYSNGTIEVFVEVLRGNLGVERRLNRAISTLITELEKYLKMTEKMYSSIDRISSKGQIVIDVLEKNRRNEEK